MFKHLVCLSFFLASPVTADQITADDYHPTDPKIVQLGQLLFYDKILSGNRNISCGTCHNHDLHGTDGLSLGIGEGGIGLGRARMAGFGDSRIRKRIPRNAPALWNLGHRDIDVLFHDGRLTPSDQYGVGFDSPAQEWLPEGLETILAAQALFPMTAQFEMAGNPKENEIAGAVHDRIDAAWPIIAARVAAVPDYGPLFIEAFDGVETTQDITIVEIGNALGQFIGAEWRSYDSPYDLGTLGPAALRGSDLFFGKGNCASCHSGPLFTDQEFHSLALPPFGPGRTRKFDPMVRDVGRMGKSDRLEDAYKFRTPSLRNVALTGPYGHNGAYPYLEGIIQHHLDPESALAQWQPQTARLPHVPWVEKIDFIVHQDTREMARVQASASIEPVALDGQEVADIVAFLKGLTGVTALERPLGKPTSVPSGLSVD
ncbi:cytochrome-c peroxidase [Algirhabdus cladophorae]|uniref:cytochrome-c peroxidase n=1 Tax=Algirhabdus cladophorae TaxID=3377108 RepID=UPI003B8460A5